MRQRQRMRPTTPAPTVVQEVAPVCPEPFCILQPPPWGGTHPGLHMAVELDGKRPLYSWWGTTPWCLSTADKPPAVTTTPGKFRVMDGDNLNRAMDRILKPSGDFHA